MIASEASSRMEAFTDVEVNLSGEAAQSAGPAAAGLVANGHAPEVSPFPFWLFHSEGCPPSRPIYFRANTCQHKDAALTPVILEWVVPEHPEQGDCAQANGHPSPRSASKRAPAPMPALAKQALSENGISPRPSANGKSSGAKKGDSADAWSKAQTDALVLVSLPPILS